MCRTTYTVGAWTAYLTTTVEIWVSRLPSIGFPLKPWIPTLPDLSGQPHSSHPHLRPNLSSVSQSHPRQMRLYLQARARFSERQTISANVSENFFSGMSGKIHQRQIASERHLFKMTVYLQSQDLLRTAIDHPSLPP